ARHAKLQGNVTLRVLVTADGRASRLNIVRGIGLGLDERAMETVRKWRFEPARDAKRNALAQWVTVEVTYRLFWNEAGSIWFVCSPRDCWIAANRTIQRRGH